MVLLKQFHQHSYDVARPSTAILKYKLPDFNEYMLSSAFTWFMSFIPLTEIMGWSVIINSFLRSYKQ